jgi:prephenate dehydrogenase
LGLVGGSLARGLTRVLASSDGSIPVAVVGWTPDAADALAAWEHGVLSEPVTTREAALADADLVVLAAPLAASVDLMDVVARDAPSEATVTDVVSLKAPLARAAVTAGLAARWVGSHPMAGAEASGFGASRDDLFGDATVWTTSAGAEPHRVDAVHALWTSLGGHPVAIEADEHDRLMALVSHLPQLASNAVAEVLAEAGIAPERLGPGGRDVTRLAASSPEMWGDLLREAPPELAAALRNLAGSLAGLADHLERGDVHTIVRAMERTRDWSAGS